MKRYIRAGKRFVQEPFDRLKSKLGIGWYDGASLGSESFDKCNFVLRPGYNESLDKWVDKIKSIGGKYVRKRYGRIYFYYDMSNLQADYASETKQAEEDYTAELNAFDIDQYKPDNATIQKIINYRDKGSKVNVNAIKDENKVLKYYYTACLVDWDDLAGACWDKLCGLGRGYSYEKREYFRDLMEAISRRVEHEDQYTDTRTDMEQRYDLPHTNGLFTFEDRSCWVPKSILMYFVDNNIPVHFGKRTGGSEWDRTGRQWSEVEHLTIFPDSSNPINYDIVVHTDEGGGATRYTGRGTGERVSAKAVLDSIAGYVERHQGV